MSVIEKEQITTKFLKSIISRMVGAIKVPQELPDSIKLDHRNALSNPSHIW